MPTGPLSFVAPVSGLKDIKGTTAAVNLNLTSDGIGAGVGSDSAVPDPRETAIDYNVVNNVRIDATTLNGFRELFAVQFVDAVHEPAITTLLPHSLQLPIRRLPEVDGGAGNPAFQPRRNSEKPLVPSPASSSFSATWTSSATLPWDLFSSSC